MSDKRPKKTTVTKTKNGATITFSKKSGQAFAREICERSKLKSCYECKAFSFNIKTREHACWYGNNIKDDSFDGECPRPKTWKEFYAACCSAAREVVAGRD